MQVDSNCPPCIFEKEKKMFRPTINIQGSEALSLPLVNKNGSSQFSFSFPVVYFKRDTLKTHSTRADNKKMASQNSAFSSDQLELGTFNKILQLKQNRKNSYNSAAFFFFSQYLNLDTLAKSKLKSRQHIKAF